MKSDTRRLIQRCRHPLEMKLFAVAALLTTVVFLLALSASFFHGEVMDAARETALETHREAHPDAVSLEDAKVLERLSPDERELIDALDWLHWPIVLLAPAALVLYIAFSIGLTYGQMRAHGVRVGPNQYPDVWEMWVDMARQLDIHPPPELYVRNGDGQLNAFVTCVPGWRAFSVVYSDLLERCLATQDWKALRFVLGHELGHLRLNHVRWWYICLTLAGNVTGVNYLVGLPLSRAREYGCDKLGACLAGEHAHRGLLMLAAGKHLYAKVDLEQYLDDHVRQPSRWDAIFNAMNGHPNIAWRIRALVERRAGHLMHSGGSTPPDPT